MPPFVQLNRTFIDFNPNSTNEQDNYSFNFGSPHWNAKTWDDLLKNQCSVILAEAGNGKTVERRVKAMELRRAGEIAFFCRLEMLADKFLKETIEIGTAEELQTWAQGTVHGYFFLDSVNEARLTKTEDFEMAIVHLVDIIKPDQNRVTIVISTRPHAWQAQANPAMLNRRLAPPNETETAEFETGSADQFSLSTLFDADIPKKAKKKNTWFITIVQMTPLNEEQVHTFSRAHGATDIDNFMEALERADADAFASRPANLPGLIKIWKDTNRIGRYSEVVANNIKLKLSEENPTHGENSPLAPDRAYKGAEALATAVTLAKRTSIRLPDYPVDSALLDKSIDPKEVLSSWTPSEMQALMSEQIHWNDPFYR